MPGIIREFDQSIGHCWPSMKAIATSSKVFIESVKPILVGDTYGPHPGNCGNLGPHEGTAIGAGTNVYIEGKQVHRDGDPISCGDSAGLIGKPFTVFANGGGDTGPAGQRDPTQTTSFSVFPPTIIYEKSLFHINIAVGGSIGQGPSACYFETEMKDLYTKLVEEFSNREYKNYPRIGANLPSYASNFYKDPIEIVLEASLPKGLVFNSLTGKISGFVDNNFQGANSSLSAINYVGKTTINITFLPNYVRSC